MVNQRVSRGLYRNAQGVLTRNAGMAPPMNGGNPGRPMMQPPMQKPLTRGNVNDTPSPWGQGSTLPGQLPKTHIPAQWQNQPMQYQPMQTGGAEPMPMQTGGAEPMPMQTGGAEPMPMQTGGGDPYNGPSSGGFVSAETAAVNADNNPTTGMGLGHGSYQDMMQKMAMQKYGIDPGMNGPPPGFGGFGGFNKGSGSGDGGFGPMMMGQGAAQAAAYGANALGNGAPPPNVQPAQPQKFQHIGAGQYRGQNGQVVNSAQNPGNIKGLLSKPPVR